MSRRGGRGGARDGREVRDDDDTTVDRIMVALERWPDGMHDLGEPRIDLPHAWPAAVVDVYLSMGGARLFGDSLILHPPDEIAGPEDGLYDVGELDGEPIWFDAKGRVWREDADTGDRVIDGTAFDRWLHGAIDATAMLFDDDGEFAEDAFTDDGEVAPEVALARVRAQVKRDTRAPGPRWRLARLLAAGGDLDIARRELEDVVAHAPTLPWAWMDLAKISERLGELRGAIDEAVAAAEADPHHEQRGYFLAEAARLAAAAGDEAQRAALVARVLAIDPEMVRREVAGAEDRLAAGELEDAAHLIALAKAVAPRDLQVIDLQQRIDQARAAMKT